MNFVHIFFHPSVQALSTAGLINKYRAESVKSSAAVFWHHLASTGRRDAISLTFLAAGAQESRPVAVTNVTVPALPAVSAVGAGVSGAARVGLPGAEATDTCGALDLRQPPQVPGLAVDKQVPHAAHVAEAQRRRPDLGGQHQGVAVVRQTPEIHVAVQVEDLAAFVGGKSGALAVDGDEACRAEGESTSHYTMFGVL